MTASELFDDARTTSAGDTGEYGVKLADGVTAHGTVWADRNGSRWVVYQHTPYQVFWRWNRWSLANG